MEDVIILAFMIGFILGNVLMVYANISYKKTLLLAAKAKTSERLLDGKFYYLVEENEYFDMKSAQTEKVLKGYMEELKKPNITTPLPHA